MTFASRKENHFLACDVLVSGAVAKFAKRRHCALRRKACRSTTSALLGPPSEEELAGDLICYLCRQVEGVDLDSSSFGCNPPASADANDLFWLKVKTLADTCLLCYDQSRSCCFLILIGLKALKKHSISSTLILCQPPR